MRERMRQSESIVAPTRTALSWSKTMHHTHSTHIKHSEENIQYIYTTFLNSVEMQFYYISTSDARKRKKRNTR